MANEMQNLTHGMEARLELARVIVEYKPNDNKSKCKNPYSSLQGIRHSLPTPHTLPLSFPLLLLLSLHPALSHTGLPALPQTSKLPLTSGSLQLLFSLPGPYIPLG